MGSTNNKESKITKKSDENVNHTKTKTKEARKPIAKTRVTIQYDAGFLNQIFIRGQGANLSWEKGELLKNIKNDEWVWETDTPFSSCEFKVLINDEIFEIGENHLLNAGTTLLHVPKFG